MSLLNDIHHLTFITADLDRLIAFYERVFGAHVTVAQPMFQRGRLDHFALNAASKEAFGELRSGVVAEEAGDGVVTDMGSLLNFGFTDPDGSQHELVWVKPGLPVGAGLRRAEWSRFERL